MKVTIKFKRRGRPTKAAVAARKILQYIADMEETAEEEQARTRKILFDAKFYHTPWIKQ